MSERYVMHRAIRRIAGWAVWSFFAEVHVIGGENVPKEGPLIVAATHHNMILDPSVLSSNFPHRRILHYWAKASLFASPVGKYVLTSSGVIPVDRKSKDNQVLFRGTFECLARNEAMAIFPEGTSYTEPQIMQVKDGASWSALEYLKWARLNPDKATKGDVVIVPVGIVYTNKSKYRSDVILDFGQPIYISEYEQEFLSGDDGAPRAAVKKLTQRIENDLIRSTINAPDWDTMYISRMARDLLWEKEKSVALEDFVPVSQTLVDLFCTSEATQNVNSVRRHLLNYYSLLQHSHLTNSSLSSLPLPRTLDPNHPARLPSRLVTVSILIKDSFACFIRLPFAFFPLMIHFPAYLISRYGAHLARDEEETMAQNKVVFALLLLLLLYPTLFYFLWAFFWYTPTGAVGAATIVWLLSVYHVKIIDDNYEHAKRLIAAWRVLVGVWGPRKWELSMTALAPYTTPALPAESPWIDKPRKSRSGTSTPDVKNKSTETVESKSKRKRRPPTRRVVRHVLRARVEAAQALASFFADLEKAGPNKQVYACHHLAAKYGTVYKPSESSQFVPTIEGVQNTHAGSGSRSAREVISFLRSRGAKIASLQDRREADWVALSSEGEDYSDTPGVEKDEIVWVPPSVSS